MRRTGTALLAMFALIAVATAAHAGPRRWTTSGPQGGSAFHLALDPQHPKTLYAGALGATFKTVDGAVHWRPVDDRSVGAILAVDPDHGGTVYAASSWAGVRRSTDGGRTWHPAHHGLPSFRSEFVPASPTAFGVDPWQPRVLLIGAQNSGFTSDCDFGWDAYRSTDGGSHWSKADAGMTSDSADGDGQELSRFAFDPLDGAHVYAASAGTSCDSSGGVFESHDAGATWQRADTGIRGRSVVDLAVARSDPATLYAVANGSVLRSADAGETWLPANGGLQGVVVDAVAIDPGDAQVAYAGAQGGAYKTTDGGTTWTRSSTGLDEAVAELVIDPTNPARVYAGTNGGDAVYRSDDAGASWTGASRFIDSYLPDVVAAPSNADVVYGVVGNSVGRSSDGGAHWTFGSDGLPSAENSYVCALAIDPRDPDLAYAGTPAGVYRSGDGGATWQAANAGIEGFPACALAIDPSRPRTIWAGGDARQTGYAGLYRSRDGGRGWDAAANGLSRSVTAVKVDPADPGVVYAGSGGSGVKVGVYQTVDAGAHWKRLPLDPGRPFAPDTISIVPSRPRVVYASDYEEVWRSADGGRSWIDANGGFPRHRRYTTFVNGVVASARWNVAFAATVDGVFRTTDGGRHWDLWSGGLGVRTTTGISRSGHHLYVGTASGGVYERDVR